MSSAQHLAQTGTPSSAISTHGLQAQCSPTGSKRGRREEGRVAEGEVAVVREGARARGLAPPPPPPVPKLPGALVEERIPKSGAGEVDDAPGAGAAAAVEKGDAAGAAAVAVAVAAVAAGGSSTFP